MVEDLKGGEIVMYKDDFAASLKRVEVLEAELKKLRESKKMKPSSVRKHPKGYWWGPWNADGHITILLWVVSFFCLLFFSVCVSDRGTGHIKTWLRTNLCTAIQPGDTRLLGYDVYFSDDTLICTYYDTQTQAFTKLWRLDPVIYWK
jgi:hypothetical protein